MTNNLYVKLEDRTAISVSGEDRKIFLQGLITNDINKVDDKNSIYTLMLTPQGKFLYDFFIIEHEDSFFIDCHASHKDAIIKKLSMYKLRSKVVIEDLSTQYDCVALIGEKITEQFEKLDGAATKPFCNGVAYIDSRCENLFARAIIKHKEGYSSLEEYGLCEGSFENYEEIRIKNVVPCAEVDIISGEDFPLDFSMNELNAIDYKKGCYVGQEVTTRVYHRAKIRKNFCTFKANENSDLGLSEIKVKDKKIGKITSIFKNYGCAMVKIEDVENADNFLIGDIEASVFKKHIN